MIGLGARKNTKTIIMPGLGDTEKKVSEGNKAVFVSFLKCEATHAHSSQNA